MWRKDSFYNRHNVNTNLISLRDLQVHSYWLWNLLDKLFGATLKQLAKKILLPVWVNKILKEIKISQVSIFPTGSVNVIKLILFPIRLLKHLLSLLHVMIALFYIRPYKKKVCLRNFWQKAKYCAIFIFFKFRKLAMRYAIIFYLFFF